MDVQIECNLQVNKTYDCYPFPSCDRVFCRAHSSAIYSTSFWRRAGGAFVSIIYHRARLNHPSLLKSNVEKEKTKNGPLIFASDVYVRRKPYRAACISICVLINECLNYKDAKRGVEEGENTLAGEIPCKCDLVSSVRLRRPLVNPFFFLSADNKETKGSSGFCFEKKNLSWSMRREKLQGVKDPSAQQNLKISYLWICK